MSARESSASGRSNRKSRKAPVKAAQKQTREVKKVPIVKKVTSKETEAKRIRYVFTDIVGFSRNRSVESQSDIVEALNGLVRRSVRALKVKPDDVLYMPTGDGVGIALTNESAKFDIHLRLALEILKRVRQRNDKTKNEMRRFELRIGINENVDNIVIDINGKRNVAGAGINMAQRVMSQADAGQLIAGQMVFETLTYRERYMKSFVSHTALVKHGLAIPVFQFVEAGHIGLDVKCPSVFAKAPEEEVRFSALEACYVALTIRHRDLVTKHGVVHGQNPYALTVVFWFLAHDTLVELRDNPFEASAAKLYGEGKGPIEDAFVYYKNVNFWLCSELANFVMGELKALQHFSLTSYPFFFHFSEEAEKKLRSEWPAIADHLLAVSLTNKD